MKKEKNKVGRPKLADSELKGNALSYIFIALTFAFVCLTLGVVELNNNIRVSKLKGRPVIDDPKLLRAIFT